MISADSTARLAYALKRLASRGLIIVAACLLPLMAQAQLRVDISGVGATQYPIGIVELSGDSKGETIARIIRDDLTRSGQFQLINTSGVSLDVNSTIEHDHWRNRGADYLAYGSVKLQGDQYRIEYRLSDTVSKETLDGVVFSGPEKDLRRIAHQVADRIYEKITGNRGVFSTRIAYVLQSGDKYELQIADADGQNPRVVLRSQQSIISPAWSPDGKQLAYVSFELGKPVIYVQELATGKRQPLANFKGNNSAPTWSPDGEQLAIVLSRDAISQIYTIKKDGSGLSRVMQSPLIDTEPSFTPDGSSLVFTSDRSGNPQVYRVPVDGGDATRLTFHGSYNISPSVSPDGNYLVYVTRRDGAFRIALLDLNTDTENLLTDGADDQSPSFAPNGMQVLYSAIEGGRSVLAVTSVDGRVRQTLSALNGKIREPVWGPFTN